MRDDPTSRPSGPGDHEAISQPGLRTRMKLEARRVSSQHRQLDEFHRLVVEALGRGSLQAARLAFTRFRDALEAHIALEDRVFFPALHGLRPDLERDLAALVSEHGDFRVSLEQLHDTLAEGSAETFAEQLDRLVDHVAAHELREEELLASISPAAAGRGDAK